MSERPAARTVTCATVLFYSVVLCAVGIMQFTPLQAKDYEKYDDISPSVRAWIESLTDNLRVPCCATADGLVPNAWEMQKDHYRLKIFGVWLVVPDTAVVKSRNRLGNAVV
jgi:hypothetical protein